MLDISLGIAREKLKSALAYEAWELSATATAAAKWEKYVKAKEREAREYDNLRFLVATAGVK